MESSFLTRVSQQYPSDWYDFSKSVFVGTKIKITIVCPDHGEFTTTPDRFLYSSGCPSCKDLDRICGRPFMNRMKRIRDGVPPPKAPRQPKAVKTPKVVRAKNPPKLVKAPNIVKTKVKKRHFIYVNKVGEMDIKIGITSEGVDWRLAQMQRYCSLPISNLYYREFDKRKTCERLEQLIKTLFRMRTVDVLVMRDGASETTSKENYDHIVRIIKSI